MRYQNRQELFIRYIEDRLKHPLREGDLEFYISHNLVGTRDVDLYHQIAQSLNILRIQTKGHIHYNIKVPQDRHVKPWDFSLMGNKDLEFIAKYGELYHFVKPNKT